MTLCNYFFKNENCFILKNIKNTKYLSEVIFDVTELCTVKKSIFHFNKNFGKICVHLRNMSGLTIKSNFLGNVLLEEKGSCVN